jgi:hypothetical protein
MNWKGKLMKLKRLSFLVAAICLGVSGFTAMFSAISNQDFSAKLKEVRRLADRFSLNDTQKTSFQNDAKELISGQGVASPSQIAQLKQTLEDARWGGVFGATAEAELEGLIAKIGSVSADTSSGSTTSESSSTVKMSESAGDLSIPFGDRVSMKVGELYKIPPAQFTKWQSDQYMAGLKALSDEAAGAFAEELDTFKTTLASIRQSPHYRSNDAANAQIKNITAELNNITYDKRVGYLERVYDGATFANQAQQERFMIHLNSLVNAIGQASDEERSRLYGLMQYAKASMLKSRASDIESLLGYVSVEAGAKTASGLPYDTKISNFTTHLTELGRLWYQDNSKALVEKTKVLNELKKLVEDRGDAIENELVQLRSIINAARWNAAFKQDSLAQEKLLGFDSESSSVTYAMRLDNVEKIYSGVNLNQAQMLRYMKHFASLSADSDSANEKEKARLREVLTFAKYNQFVSDEKEINNYLASFADRFSISVPEGTSREVPAAGSFVVLYSLGDVAGENGNQRYLKAEQIDGGGGYFLRSTAEDLLDLAAQFEVVMSEGRIGFKTNSFGEKGLFLETPPIGQSGAGRAHFVNKDFTALESNALRFFMYGTLEEASFLNDASRGYLSVRKNQDVVAIDPLTLAPISLQSDGTLSTAEKFKVIILSEFHVGLGKARRQGPTDAVTAYVTLFREIDDASDRTVYISELEKFITRIRATSDAWDLYKANSSTVNSFESLIDYISFSPDFSDFKKRIEQMQEDLTKGVSAGELPIDRLAIEAEMPKAGSRVALFSLWAEKDGSNPLGKYIRVVKNEDGKFLVVATAESMLDSSSQFEVIREGARISFRSTAADNMVLRSVAIGEKGAGSATFANKDISGNEERFAMVGTRDRASFLNEATKGYLSVRRDKSVMSLDPDTFEPAGVMIEGVLTPYSWEQFKIVELTSFYLELSAARGKNDLVRLDDYNNLVDKAQTNEERAALIKEIRFFITSKRTSREKWSQADDNDIMMAKIDGLLVSLFGRSSYRPYNGYVKELLDIMSLGERKELALSPRGGAYVWLVEDKFKPPAGTGVQFNLSVQGYNNVQIAFGNESTLRGESSPMYEVILGANENTNSVIKRLGQEVEQFSYTVKSRNSEKVWVSYDGSSINIGTGQTGLNKIISWQDPGAAQTVEYVGVGSNATPAWITNLEVAGAAEEVQAVENESFAQTTDRLVDRLARLTSPDELFLSELERLVNRRLEAKEEDYSDVDTLLNNARYNSNFYDVRAAQDKINKLAEALHSDVGVDQRLAFGWILKNMPKELKDFQREYVLRNVTALVESKDLMDDAKKTEAANMLKFAIHNQFMNDQEQIQKLIGKLTGEKANLRPVEEIIEELKAKIDGISSMESRAAFMAAVEAAVADFLGREEIPAEDKLAMVEFLKSLKDGPDAWKFQDVPDAVSELIKRVQIGRGLAGEVSKVKILVEAAKMPNSPEATAAIDALVALVKEIGEAYSAGTLRDETRVQTSSLIEGMKGSLIFVSQSARLADLASKVDGTKGLAEKIQTLKVDLSEVNTSAERDSFLKSLEGLVVAIEAARAADLAKDYDLQAAIDLVNDATGNWYFGGVQNELKKLIARIKSEPTLAVKISRMTAEISGIDSQEEQVEFMKRLKELVSDWQESRAVGDAQTNDSSGITSLIDAVMANWLFGSLSSELSELKSKITGEMPLNSKIQVLFEKMKEVLDAQTVTQSDKARFVASASVFTSLLTNMTNEQRTTLKSYVEKAKSIAGMTDAEKATIDALLKSISDIMGTGSSVPAPSINSILRPQREVDVQAVDPVATTPAAVVGRVGRQGSIQVIRPSAVQTRTEYNQRARGARR